MSKERKAAVIIDADVKPFERGLRDAEGLMKGFEKKAAKSGYGHVYRGRDKSVGGVLAGAGGGGAAGTARAFFGGWMAAEAMEGAINLLTIGLRKHQYAQAKSTGDLEKMGQAAIKVNQAQEQLVSSFPVLGGSIARLMRVMGGTEQLQDAMDRMKLAASGLDSINKSMVDLGDSIAVLEMVIAGATQSEIDSFRNQTETEKAIIESKERESVAAKRLAGSMNKLEDTNKKIKEAEERREKLNTAASSLNPGMTAMAKMGTRKEEDGIKESLEARMLVNQKAVEDDTFAVEKEREYQEEKQRELTRKNEVARIAEEKRIADFIRDKEYEILQVKLNNELANQEDAWGIWFERSKLLYLEEQFLMDKMQREKASQEEQDVVFRLFRQREESLYGERERALAKEREESDKKQRDLQRRLNATDNATTAAYVSMSGAVTNASAEQQTAKNTMELVKETRMTNRELRRLTQAQQAAYFGKQAEGFRRERLN